MSRIENRLARLKAEGRSALIPYVTAGDPAPGVTVNLMHALVEAGADIIELGVPFSDPMADGPVIQLACERALVHGVTLKDVLAMVSQFRETDADTPVVLMGYTNPIEAMGYADFIERAKVAGVDGVLTVDLPPEEAEAFTGPLKQAGMDAVFLLAPTTSEARMRSICEASSGYVYYVSVKGVTGSAALDVEAVAGQLEKIRAQTGLPLGVGFGIKDGASAAAVSRIADGVIVGSVLVNKIAELASEPDKVPAAVAAIVADMRAAMDRA
ncbi:tryptophan synthase subunit alpha [Motiliproteus sp. SC1-56]|uniref:tryptophan synthase subunit alpha n=1 Tax=Motiliproteus sp. SC1-56 TaxID=2799565 RepID=UPI001A8FF5EE|nr:tryptophan synthase subunit alpha [Motiliproteus sp. SC1-56]